VLVEQEQIFLQPLDQHQVYLMLVFMLEVVVDQDMLLHLDPLLNVDKE
jgi:hypothetical protein